TVQIEWNAAMIDVPGITVHEKNVDDLVLLQVTGANLKPCQQAPIPAKKFDSMIVLGTVRDTTGARAIKASPAKAEVQEVGGGMFSCNVTVPGTFAGAPVLEYDGKIYGFVVGTEGANLICLP